MFSCRGSRLAGCVAKLPMHAGRRGACLLLYRAALLRVASYRVQLVACGVSYTGVGPPSVPNQRRALKTGPASGRPPHRTSVPSSIPNQRWAALYTGPALGCPPSIPDQRWAAADRDSHASRVSQSPAGAFPPPSFQDV
eukprot:gene11690-biopygen3372